MSETTTVPDLLVRLERQAAAIEAVRALHINDAIEAAAQELPGMCEVCMWAWPCPTIRALDEHQPTTDPTAKDAPDA